MTSRHSLRLVHLRHERGATSLEMAIILPSVAALVGLILFFSYGFTVLFLGTAGAGQGSRTIGLAQGGGSAAGGSLFTSLLPSLNAPGYQQSVDGCQRRNQARWGQTVSGDVPFLGTLSAGLHMSSVGRNWGPHFGPVDGWALNTCQ